jgi:hypothetical protein
MTEEIDMALREVRVTGREALMLVTELLQRVRRTDPQAGLWEAADLQWLWWKPTTSTNSSGSTITGTATWYQTK